MPPFKIRDLVIDVNPELCVRGTCRFLSVACQFATPCGWRTCWGGTCFLGTCRPPTFVQCPAGTIDITTIIECTGSACGGSAVDPTLIEQPQDLGVLKQQLQAQLRQVEELEKQQAEAARPQTLAEAEDLEKKLRGALEEIQTLKKTLKK